MHANNITHPINLLPETVCQLKCRLLVENKYVRPISAPAGSALAPAAWRNQRPWVSGLAFRPAARAHNLNFCPLGLSDNAVLESVFSLARSLEGAVAGVRPI